MGSYIKMQETHYLNFSWPQFIKIGKQLFGVDVCLASKFDFLSRIQSKSETINVYRHYHHFKSSVVLPVVQNTFNWGIAIFTVTPVYLNY